MEALFWTMLIGAGYSYFLYPVMLLVFRAVHRRAILTTPPDPTLPRVSLIITAHNEEVRIQQKLENSVALDYPDLEIIVASDCSTDGTDCIVSGFECKGVRLVRAPERKGKEFAQLCAIREARGKILVFSDAGTQIERDSITLLVRYFEDPHIGAVSSEDRFIRNNGEIAGEGAYVRYEMLLRRLESELGGLVGLSGSYFAVRAEFCTDWDTESPSDFNTALNCADAGQRAITAPNVLGYYNDLQDPSREYQRKVRTVLRGITGLMRRKEVLSIPRYGIFAWQVLSHKVMRWLVPVFLTGLLTCSLMLAGEHWLYALFVFGQLTVYGIALAAHFAPRLRRHPLVRIFYFFCQVNLAIAHAMVRFISGTRMNTWQPSAR